MFTRSERLRKGFEIQKAFQKGENFRSPFFILKFLKWNTFKVTVVVSKKISKSAVERNRVKRIFRAAIREKLKEHKVKWSLVFLPSANTLGLKSIDIEKEIWKKLKSLVVK